MTAPAAPTSSTARELITAILAAPDEDTHRLAFADLAEEEGDVEHAELIRVQCELARLMPERMLVGFYRCSVCGAMAGDFHKDDCRYCALRKREQALPPTLRARLMPACYKCEGKGSRYADDEATLAEYEARTRRTRPYLLEIKCDACSGSGICHGDIVRGFPVCKVPLETLGSQVWCCKACFDSTGDAWAVSKERCINCGLSAHTAWVWQPAKWLAAARERGATVEPEPLPGQIFVSQNRSGKWFIMYGDLPLSLVLQLRRSGEDDRKYDSRAAAVAALGRAVMGITSDSSKESSAC